MGGDRIDHERIRRFYDDVRHAGVAAPSGPSAYDRRLAARLGIPRGVRVLDVACSSGAWLLAISERGAVPAGVDISEVALRAARQALPDAELHTCEAESLPLADDRFDWVTCLGSLEHFLDPAAALAEMTRVARPDARFVFVVPNADFPTRRLGLFSGTRQVAVKEEVRTIEGWEALFAAAGLAVERRWRDLHVLSWRWIASGRRWMIPLRAAQALALFCWPLRWQYQVGFLCRRASGKEAARARSSPG